MVEDFRTQYAFSTEVKFTVNFTSVEKLRTLHIAWLHRKVMAEDFCTQYAFFNGSEIYCTVMTDNTITVCLLAPPRHNKA